MDKKLIIYETVSNRDFISMQWHLNRGYSVWVMEPTYMYHHKKGITFFPPPLSHNAERLIQKGKVSVLRADMLNAKEIYQIAADKACDNIEPVYSVYKEEYKKLFSCVSDILKSSIAENVFKKSLCDRLAEFYSVNILLHRIETFFPNAKIIFSASADISSYLYFKKLLSNGKYEFFENQNIRFSLSSRTDGMLRSLKQNLKSVFMVLAQTIASGIFSKLHLSSNKKEKFFKYGITIVGPRQLRGNLRWPGFIIDSKEISGNEVVFFPLMPLTTEQKRELTQLSSEIFMIPKPGRFYSNFPEWRKLLWTALKEKFLGNGNELYTAGITLFNYFRWKRVLETVKVRHFITHCDFGIDHIGRNLAIKEAGAQTWYFTDSMNFANNLKEDVKSTDKRHPFWTYLFYDHFVTWSAFLADFLKSHPGTFKQAHVVGCLWSGHIVEKKQARKETTVLKDINNKFVVAVYDTTYSNNGVTSYVEGILFAEHILRLSEDITDIHIFFKEKKDRSVHKILDPVNGPKLLELYNKMNTRLTITICSNQIDASNLTSISDMVISFPFTSTTFETLSINRPAVWHDPMGYYKNTQYGKIHGVTTHSYDELKARVLEIKSIGDGTYRTPMPLESPLMDPFRDGKAIERFRKILVNSY